MSRVATAAVVIALAAAAGGCPSDPPFEDDLVLYGLTAAPPASKATILNSDTEGYTITLSRGVAIAARCWDTCATTCEALHVTADDPTLLGVRPLWRPDGGGSDVVLVASRSGTTSLRVETACTSRTYQVQVIDR